MTQPAVRQSHVVIVGLMGVGKSTTAGALADALGRPFVDSDRDIETLLGEPGSAFAATEGVPALHRLEAAVLLGALSRREHAVIAAAASTIEDPLVRLIAVRRSLVVRLDAPLDLVLRRQAGGAHRRAMDEAELTDIAKRREPLFASVETLRLDARNATATLVDEIVDYLEGDHRTRRSASSGPDR